MKSYVTKHNGHKLRGLCFDSVRELVDMPFTQQIVGRNNYKAAIDLAEKPLHWFGLTPDILSKEQTARLYHGSSSRGFVEESYLNIRKVSAELATEGSDALVQLIRARFQQLEADTHFKVSRLKKTKCFSDSGDEVDIHRVMSGDLDKAWRTTRRKVVDGARTGQKIVLSVPLGGTFDVSAEELFWQGATAFYLSEKLMAAGYSVGIIGVSVASNCDTRCLSDYFMTSVVVKPLEKKVSGSVLAGCLGVASFFRMLLLTARCAIPGIFIKHSMGGTQSVPLPKEATPPGARVLDMPAIRSLYGARAYLKQVSQEMQSPVRKTVA